MNLYANWIGSIPLHLNWTWPGEILVLEVPQGIPKIYKNKGRNTFKDYYAFYLSLHFCTFSSFSGRLGMSLAIFKFVGFLGGIVDSKSMMH